MKDSEPNLESVPSERKMTSGSCTVLLVLACGKTSVAIALTNKRCNTDYTKFLRLK